MDSKNKAGQKEGANHTKQAGHPSREHAQAGTSMERHEGEKFQAPKSGHQHKQKEGHIKSGKK